VDVLDPTAPSDRAGSAARRGVRTMIAALIPDAEPLVGAFRAQLDPTARRGLGAHVTLVYPFVEPAAVAGATVAALRDTVAAVPAFTCTFGELRWFGDKVLWLAPDAVAAFGGSRSASGRRSRSCSSTTARSSRT